MLKKIAFAGLGVALLASPLLASADTLSDLQAQVQALLSQIAALQAQVKPATPTPSSVPPQQPDDYGTGVTVGNYCPKLSITMQRGSRDATTGGQVSELQTFLTDYYNLDENIVVGGYFGNLTHKYVVRFQTEQGLPAFGIAGSLTRAKIASVCGGQKPQPSNDITVTAPNGGERWEAGVLNTVTWRPYQYNPDINPAKDVTAYLERYLGEKENGEKVFETLGKVEESGKASIHWISGYLNNSIGPVTLANPGSNYYIRVVNNVTGAGDRSDAPFTLLPKPVDLKINGSDGPVTLSAGQQVTVSWKTSGVSSCGFGGVGGFNIPVANEVEGSATGIYGGGNILMNCTRNETGLIASDWVYVNTPSVPASLQVTSPNGGESIAASDATQVKIAWRMKNITTPISIALYKDDKWLSWIAKDLGMDLSLDGTYSYTWVPNAKGPALPPLSSGSNSGFKIYITGQKADGTGYVDDKSDAPFSFTVGVAAVEIPTPVFKT